MAFMELLVVLGYVGLGAFFHCEGWDGGYYCYYGEGCVLLLGEVCCYL